MTEQIYDDADFPLKEQSKENEIVMRILHRIGEQPEFKEAWKNLPNAERNYLCGDIYNIIAEVFRNKTGE